MPSSKPRGTGAVGERQVRLQQSVLLIVLYVSIKLYLETLGPVSTSEEILDGLNDGLESGKPSVELLLD